MQNLIKRTFMTTDTRGCQFRVTLYKTACGWENGARLFDTEYTTDLFGGVSASTLDELKRKVGAL